jgi:AcrR family transcriptional regulator
VTSRKYEQRVRADGAQETRRRVLDVMYDRLRDRPAEPVSVDHVARLAGVARSTIYLIFGSRSGLFDALGADVLQRGGFDEMLRATAHPDAIEGLRGGIRSNVRMYAAHRDVLRALFSMAMLDADAFSGAVGRMEKGRAEGVAHRARRLGEQRVLRPGVTVAEAAHVLWVLTSFDSFDLLYKGRSLSVDQVAKTLTMTAERSLCR